MTRVFALAALLALAPGPSRAAGREDPMVTGVERLIRIELAAGPGTSPVRPFALPGRRAIQFDVSAGLEEARAAVVHVPEPFRVELRPIERGTRIRIVHPDRELRFAAGTFRERGQTRQLITLGAESEEVRLRKLSSDTRRPLPAPPRLGANLELWTEAERTTSAGKLRLAKRLWEKLTEVPDLADLAALRVAELFVISGHVGEANELLRDVSRRYPRSTGASLGRLSSLQLEAITGEGAPTSEQVLIAASAISRPAFQHFAWLRAAAVLSLLEDHANALDNFPRIDEVPTAWRDQATAEHHRILAAAVGVPFARRQPLESLAQYQTWTEALAGHPEADALAAIVIESYLELGLAEPAVELLRERLRALPGPHEEAEIVAQLATALAAIGDVDRQSEAVEFQVRKHPDAPSTPGLLRRLILQERRLVGTEAALGRIARLRALTGAPTLARTLGALEVDLLEVDAGPDRVVEAIERLRKLGFDDADRRERSLAAALARAGRAADAEPQLRRVIVRTTDPELRDYLAYLLADAEAALGRDSDAVQILESLASRGTRWGFVARARLQERTLQAVVRTLELRAQDDGKPTPPEPKPS